MGKCRIDDVWNTQEEAAQRETAEVLSREIVRFALENDGAMLPSTALVQMTGIWFDTYEYRKTEEDVKNVVLSAVALSNAKLNGPGDDPLGDEIAAILAEAAAKPTNDVEPEPVVSDEELAERVAALQTSLSKKC